MRSVFEKYWHALVNPVLPTAVLIEYKVEQTDGQNPINLETLKKYLRVDGNYEDDLLTAILSAGIYYVEKMRNVSLTGKHVRATFTHGRMDKSYLPFSDEIVEELEVVSDGTCTYFEYITSPTKDAQIHMEVMEYCKERYENRTMSGGKRVYL